MICLVAPRVPHLNQARSRAAILAITQLKEAEHSVCVAISHAEVALDIVVATTGRASLNYFVVVVMID